MKKLLLNVVFVLLFVAAGQLRSVAQNTYTMCTGTSTTDSMGTLYDSGGPNDVYQVSEDCTLLVAPSCATSITLTFQYFATESGWDFFHVYDGQTTAAPELLNISGAVLPSPVTCTSGYMLLVWHADFTIVDSGFIASWTSVIAPSVAPTAAFTMSTNNPPLGTDVQFTNTSVGGTTGWLWDFGDGDTAQTADPLHHYTTPGTYTVTFIAFQCSETDTITHTVTVQAAPHINVTPAIGFTASVQCGDSANFIMNVANTGGGDLVYSTDGSIVGQINVLAMTYGTNQFVEFPRTIAAINAHFTNYTLTTTGTVVPGVLAGLLVGKNVLLIPEQQNNTGSNVWQNLGPVIQQYLNNGGSVIFCGSASSLSDNLFQTGVFTGSFVQDVAGFSVNVIDPLDPLVAGIGTPTFVGPSSTFSMNITNPNKVTVVDYQGSDIVTYRYYGAGKAIYIAFDYYDANNSTELVIANAIQWGGQNALAQWIHLSLTNDTVTAPQSHQVGVTFIASSLPAGTYYANIGIGSNDPTNPLVAVPCTLTVSGLPFISLSEICLNYDSVMQYTTVRDTVRIINTGCDTLKLDSVFSTGAAFTINPGLHYLLPGAFADVVVTLNDSVVGPVTDSIIVNNNDVDTVICLSAYIFPAPQTGTSVPSIFEGLRACGDSGTVTFDITNVGVANAGHLIFNLGSLPAWVTASPTTGDLAQGASTTITLNFGSGTLTGQNYYTNITIISNDPLHPNKYVPCTLNVDTNPCVDFTFISNTCTGFSTFTSTSINTPTSYSWDFGDGGTSSVANPTHVYPQNGQYTTTLIACNNRGCDTVTQTVNAIITGPRPTSCYPFTSAYCCGIGIINFQIFDGASFLINNSSNDAVDGYMDYTCTDTATLATNHAYNINVTTGFSYEERVRMWVDLNNDAFLDTLTELVYDSTGLINHGGTFTLPDYPTTVYNLPVRVRVGSDYSANATPWPCIDSLLFGQFEDYSIFISPINSVKNINNEIAFSVYPNPFKQSTSIEYNLKNSSEVSVEVLNILGEQISSFANTELQAAGKHTYQFSGQPSGIYFVKLTVDGISNTQKLIKM